MENVKFKEAGYQEESVEEEILQRPAMEYEEENAVREARNLCEKGHGIEPSNDVKEQEKKDDYGVEVENGEGEIISEQKNENRNEKYDKERKFKCIQCPKSYFRSAELARHRKEI